MGGGQTRRGAVGGVVARRGGVWGGDAALGGDGRKAGTSLRGRDAAALNHSRSLELQHDEASLISPTLLSYKLMSRQSSTFLMKLQSRQRCEEVTK